jgi:hypothetical protein
VRTCLGCFEDGIGSGEGTLLGSLTSLTTLVWEIASIASSGCDFEDALFGDLRVIAAFSTNLQLSVPKRDGAHQFVFFAGARQFP